MATSISSSIVRLASSRIRLWIQKKLAVRRPRVTGVTWCRLELGYRIMSPAPSLTTWSP